MLTMWMNLIENIKYLATACARMNYFKKALQRWLNTLGLCCNNIYPPNSYWAERIQRKEETIGASSQKYIFVMLKEINVTKYMLKKFYCSTHLFKKLIIQPQKFYDPELLQKTKI